jgi:hypothetical protein
MFRGTQPLRKLGSGCIFKGTTNFLKLEYTLDIVNALPARGPIIGVQFPARAWDFSHLHSIQTDPGPTHPPSQRYRVQGTGALSST